MQFQKLAKSERSRIIYRVHASNNSMNEVITHIEWNELNTRYKHYVLHVQNHLFTQHERQHYIDVEKLQNKRLKL